MMKGVFDIANHKKHNFNRPLSAAYSPLLDRRFADPVARRRVSGRYERSGWEWLNSVFRDIITP